MTYITCYLVLPRLVGQSEISANPELKSNPNFWFVYFCAHFETSEEEQALVTHDTIIDEKFILFKQNLAKFALDYKAFIASNLNKNQRH